MTTITIELTDEQTQQLAQEAERMHLPVQDLVTQRLLTPWQRDERGADGVSFEEAMEYVFEKNSELYGRLA